MKITNHKLQIINGLLIISLFLLTASVGQAKVVIVNSNDGSVINNVSVQANSGGQTVVNGEVVAGDSSAQVKIKTEINGQTVQDIDESASAGQAQIEVKSEVRVQGDQAEVNTEINNQGEETKSQEAIDLDSDSDIEGDTEENGMGEQVEGLADGQPADKEISHEVVILFTSFWQSVAQFFQNIFSIFK